tara:strand:+ start:285 stop:488 length:204 start_codon:yes stop_codon:yes gene_type:complete
MNLLEGNVMAKLVQLKGQSILIDAPCEMVYQKMIAFNRGYDSEDINEYSKALSQHGNKLVVGFKIKS